MEESSSESEERREATDAEREAAEEADAEDTFDDLGSRIKMYINDDFLTLYICHGGVVLIVCECHQLTRARAWPSPWHPTWQRRSAVLPLVDCQKAVGIQDSKSFTPIIANYSHTYNPVSPIWST